MCVSRNSRIIRRAWHAAAVAYAACPASCGDRLTPAFVDGAPPSAAAMTPDLPLGHRRRNADEAFFWRHLNEAVLHARGNNIRWQILIAPALFVCIVSSSRNDLDAEARRTAWLRHVGVKRRGCREISSAGMRAMPYQCRNAGNLIFAIVKAISSILSRHRIFSRARRASTFFEIPMRHEKLVHDEVLACMLTAKSVGRRTFS